MAKKPNQYDSNIESRLDVSQIKSNIQSRLIVNDDSDHLDALSADNMTDSISLGEDGVGKAHLSFIAKLHPVQQGVIWAEILGKPVCKRRSRGRYGL